MADKMNIEEQVAHFLRLAEDAGATEAEREMAARRAEALMTKHAIDRAILEDKLGQHQDEEIVHVKVEIHSDPYCTNILTGIHMVVRSLKLQAYHMDNRKQRAKYKSLKDLPQFVVMIVGFERDAEEAVRLINSLQVQSMVSLKGWWKNHPMRGILGRQDEGDLRRGYVVGFYQGAASRIKEMRAEVIADANLGEAGALVLVKRDEKIKSEYDRFMDVMRDPKGRGTSLRSASHAGKTAGFQDGRNASGLGGGNALSGAQRSISA